MDYKKLATDLLSVCEENCADCKYAGDSEFECTIAELAATAINDLLALAEAAEKRVEELEKSLSDAAQVVKTMQERTIPYYRNRAEAAEKEVEWKNKVIEAAERRFVEAEARAEKAERERDAAVKVIERVRSCKDCGHYTGEWTPPCKECQDSEEHHPCFKWRGQKKGCF